MPEKPKPANPPKSAAREARLAAALRANLKRRKTAARAAAGSDSPAPSEARNDREPKKP